MTMATTTPTTFKATAKTTWDGLADYEAEATARPLLRVDSVPVFEHLPKAEEQAYFTAPTQPHYPEEYPFLTPIQQELFDQDQINQTENLYRARQRYLAKFPDKIADFFARQYDRRQKAYGAKYASEWFKEQMAQMLPRFKMVMSQYSDMMSLWQLNAANKEASKWLDDKEFDHAAFAVMPLAQDEDDQLKESDFTAWASMHAALAKKRAQCSKLLAPIVARLHNTSEMMKGLKIKPLCYLRDDQIQQLAHSVAFNLGEQMNAFADDHIEQSDSAEAAFKILVKLYKELCETCEQYGIPAPFARECKRGRLTQDRIETGLLKMACPKYWKRKLTTTAKRMKEHLAVAVGMVCAQRGGYVSNWRLKEFQEHRRAQMDYIKSHIIVNIANPEEQVELLDMWIKSSANPANRRRELMLRANGFDTWAEHNNDACVFVTLTAPSKYHSMTHQGNPNPKWIGCSPRQTQAYLVNIWGKIRAKLSREKIKFYGFRVAEPHADATPHWHALIWCKPERMRELKRIIRSYALMEDGTEKGAWRHRCTFKNIDRKKGGAVAYLAKYISKNIDGYKLGDQLDNETGDNLKLVAERVQAWATLWGIRQFQQLGGASVTVWRELRRLGDQTQEDAVIEKLRLAAGVASDWAAYMEFMGGARVLRKDLICAPYYETKEAEETAYKEPRDIIKGLENKTNGNITRTRLKEWSKTRKPKNWKTLKDAQKDANQTSGEAAKNGAFTPPWTCVSNCTRSKNEQNEKIPEKVSEEVRDIIRKQLILMKGRVTEYQIDDLLSGKPLKIYSTDSVKVTAEWTDGQLIERKHWLV